VNAIGGFYGFPLVAALFRNHLPVAELLLQHGGNVDVRDTRKQTALHKTIDCRDMVAVDAVQFLLEHGADVNARCDDLWTPLHLAVNVGEFSVAQMLLKHQAGANSRNDDGQTPLHLLSKRETSQDQDNDCDLAKLLLEHGANVNERDRNNATPLDLASYHQKPEIIQVLLDHCAKANSETAIEKVGVRAAQLLPERGVGVKTQHKDGLTPLHIASYHGKFKVVRLLLDHGAAANAETDNGENPLHKVSCGKYESQEDGAGIAQLLLEHGVDVDVPRTDHSTPLHVASRYGNLAIARLLLNRGANASANAMGDLGSTPLHKVSYGKYKSQDHGVRVAQLLLKHGVDVNVSRTDHWTPLHVASCYGNLAIVRLLLDHGAATNAETDNGENPLHKASCGKYESQEDGLGVAQLLLEHGADVNAPRADHSTPLHVASRSGNPAIVRLLLDHGANPSANAEGDLGSTPLHKVSYGKYKSQDDGVRVAKLLLKHGVDVNVSRTDHWTPLHVASCYGNLAIVRLLLDRGAAANAETDNGEHPLHKVSCGKYEFQDDGVGVAQLLLERGVDVNAPRTDHSTPLHVASRSGNLAIARLLLDHGAKVEALNDFGRIPLHEVSQGTYNSEDAGVGVARLLLEHGADANAKAKSGQTPIDYATHNQRFKLAQLLL
ncbi:ankyrin repeat-containing domain protein, partial [Lactarius vividus]